MELRITLPPDVAERLAQQSSLLGLSSEEVVSRLLRQHLPPFRDIAASERRMREILDEAAGEPDDGYDVSDALNRNRATEGREPAHARRSEGVAG